MTLYKENPKEPTQQTSELINKLSKVIGYKINKQKLLAFLYTSNGQFKKSKMVILLMMHFKDVDKLLGSIYNIFKI